MPDKTSTDFKTGSIEKKSFGKYCRAKRSLVDDADPVFFVFIEKEVIGKGYKIEWTVELLEELYIVWNKYGDKMTSKAIWVCSVEERFWQLPVSNVLKKCQAINGQRIRAKSARKKAKQHKE